MMNDIRKMETLWYFSLSGIIFRDDVQISRAKQMHQYLITMRSTVTRAQMWTFHH